MTAVFEVQAKLDSVLSDMDATYSELIAIKVKLEQAYDSLVFVRSLTSDLSSETVGIRRMLESLDTMLGLRSMVREGITTYRNSL